MKWFAILFGLSAAVPAQAQLPGVDLILQPRVGVYTPMGNLMEVGSAEIRLRSGLALGLGVEINLPASPYDLRAGFNTIRDADVEHEGTGGTIGDADLLVVTGDVVFRVFPRVGVQPYLLAGAGIKKYSFGGNFAPGGEDGATDFTAHLGAGADLRLGPIGVLAEISDFISSFNSGAISRAQHDLFVMVGLRIGIL